MKKVLTIKNLVLSVILMSGMILPLASNAQGTDLFFRGGNDDVYNNRDEQPGITIGGMNNDNPTSPLGSGLLVLALAGVGYAVACRKRAIKKSTTLLLAFAVILGMTQCKKNPVETVSSNKVDVVLRASCGGSKTIFIPGTGSGFTWNASGYEYVSVGGSDHGYMGELRADASGGDAQTTRIIFRGQLNAAPNPGEKIYFFYLGNGQHNGATTLDFSDQSATGAAGQVTNFLVAIDEGYLIQDGDSYIGTADLQVKTAIAYFKLGGFVDSSEQDETIYMHGDQVYSTATINYAAGTITGTNKGTINVGTNGEKYVSLIASTNDETIIYFDSNSKTGEITFLHGIQEATYYSDDLVSLDAPSSTLKGLFSVSPTKMVRFSKGNLQYQKSTNKWSFMEHQYTTVETLGQNVGYNYANQDIVSLFGWGATGEKDLYHNDNELYYQPYNTKFNEWADIEQYGPTGAYNLSVDGHSDWGWCMGGENSPWHTLMRNEYKYLVEERPNHANKCGYATVAGVYGYIILPDSFTDPKTNHAGSDGSFRPESTTGWGANIYLEGDDWDMMEEAGALFLPAAGTRDEGTILNDEIRGRYWMGQCGAHTGGYILEFYENQHTVYNFDRPWGCSVRLVRDAESR